MHEFPIWTVGRDGADPYRVVRNALVIGAELITPFMDWSDRNVAVLFGDGAAAAVVLQLSDREEGLLAQKLGCYGDAREILRVHGMGGRYANQGLLYGVTHWQFEGQGIFKRAVQGMSAASESALGQLGKSAADVDLVIPHQANLRIIEAVAKRTQLPMQRVFVNVQRYGNMSSATVPVALCEALEEGRVQPNALLLMPGFGGGLSFCAHLVRWGERVTPLDQSNVQLPANIARLCRSCATCWRLKVSAGRDAALLGALALGRALGFLPALGRILRP